MIELPGLTGDHALGFLAAVGLVALGEQQAIPPLRLAWTDDSSPMALVESDDPATASRDDLAAAVRQAFEALREAGRVLPGVDPGFPVARSGVGSDPMRLPPDGMRAHFEWADERWRVADDPWPARWLVGLCGQTSVKAKGDVALTPFYAPTGQMTLRGSIFEATADAVDRVGGPGDALTGWRRTNYDGANFDERAIQDAAVTTWGDSSNQGAPSPTWLAAMGVRMFANVETARGLATVGWHRVRLYPGYTRRSLVWPVWPMPLGPAAVRALLAHPALEVREQRDDRAALPKRSALGPLGVTAVFGSSRRTSQQGDGPLGPAMRLWSRDDPAGGG